MVSQLDLIECVGEQVGVGGIVEGVDGSSSWDHF